MHYCIHPLSSCITFRTPLVSVQSEGMCNFHTIITHVSMLPCFSFSLNCFCFIYCYLCKTAWFILLFSGWFKEVFIELERLSDKIDAMSSIRVPKVKSGDAIEPFKKKTCAKDLLAYLEQIKDDFDEREKIMSYISIIQWASLIRVSDNMTIRFLYHYHPVPYSSLSILH